MTDQPLERELGTTAVLERTDTTTESPEAGNGSKAYVHIINPPANLHLPSGMTAAQRVDYAREHGLELVALCGYRWVPKIRNVDGLDACPICVDVAGMLMRNEGE